MDRDLDADELIEILVATGIVDTVGRPTSPDEPGGPLRRGAVLLGRGVHSDDDVHVYEIEVTTWTAPGHDAVRGHFAHGSLEDPRVMFFLVGRGWSLSAKHGAPDALIPIDLAERVRDALPRSVLRFHRGIPEESWFEPRFTTADAVFAVLREAGINGDFMDESDVDERPDPAHLRDLHEAGEYRSALLWGQQSTGTFVWADVLIEDRHAPELLQIARHHLAREEACWYAVGDGWAMRIATPSDIDDRVGYAFALLVAVLGGARLLMRGDVGDGRVIDDAGVLYGPQTVEVAKLYLELACSKADEPAPDPSDHHDAAWSRLHQLAVASGRTVELDRAISEVALVAVAALAATAGRSAVGALVGRDLLTEAEFALLTESWRTGSRRRPVARTSPHLVYRFLAGDAEAPAATFECRAYDDEDATRRASAAGFGDVVLYEVEDVRPALRSSAIRRRVRRHPFLGRQWNPLLEVLHAATEATSSGFWRVQVVRPLADAVGPFVQAARIPDGTMHVEVGGHVVADGPDGRRRAELAFFGWHRPRPDENKPLHHRTFDGHWSGRAIASRILETLAVVYDVDAGDLFAFAGTARRVASQSRFGMVSVGDDVYRVPALGNPS